jgi:hypothetical protein
VSIIQLAALSVVAVMVALLLVTALRAGMWFQAAFLLCMVALVIAGAIAPDETLAFLTAPRF